MKNIVLHSSQISFTAVPNTFLDDYMPKANGEFVKVYLYLYRCLNGADGALSISGIADKLNHTEADVHRALRYWEQTGLLALTYTDGNILTDITLTSPEPVAAEEPTAGRPVMAEDLPAAVPVPEKSTYTKAQLNKFLEMEDISQVLYIAQRYLGKTLSATETNTILYFYDSLRFPVDLIEYLIEYCVSRDHKSMRYIETVALSWAKQGICTVADAKDASLLYNKNCFAVMKAFGLTNRNPGNSELQLIQKWSKTFDFSLDLILEACNRTIQTIHQPSFEYADSILSRWKSMGVKHLSDVQRLDEAHEKNRESRPEKTVPGQNPANRFNNITPRSYLYDDLEKQLLNH